MTNPVFVRRRGDPFSCDRCGAIMMLGFMTVIGGATVLLGFFRWQSQAWRYNVFTNALLGVGMAMMALGYANYYAKYAGGANVNKDTNDAPFLYFYLFANLQALVCFVVLQTHAGSHPEARKEGLCVVPLFPGSLILSSGSLS